MIPSETIQEKNDMSRSGSKLQTSSSTDSYDAVAVPTLRVMRLQSPELHTPSAGDFGHSSLLHNSLCLPDSLGVYVGEMFTAYLGVLNSSTQFTIRKLSINAQLQTPTQRWTLGSHLENGVQVPPESGVDCIVSHGIEESGQHILRVEVNYQSVEGDTKSFRKFYRFQVVNPLHISHRILRFGDSACFVSVTVGYNPSDSNVGSIVLAGTDFIPAEGLSSTQIGRDEKILPEKNAVQLLDKSGIMKMGTKANYIFKVEATSDEAQLKGIAAGDLIGTAVFTWRKAMGETGRVSSPPIHCPKLEPNTDSSDPHNNFLVHRSGLSVDVAAAAASRNPNDRLGISYILPVTVEPIDPPSRMTMNVPASIQFLVVNHSDQSMALQLQFRLSQMKGLAVCGPSFQSLGQVAANGGSIVVTMQFLALAAGQLRVQGCWVVDLASGREIPQPPLVEILVDRDASQ